MRVLIITDGLGNGGAERQLALLATSLPDEVPVRVLSLEGGAFVDVLEAAGIEVVVHHRRHRYDVAAAQHIAREIDDFAPDVVHTWGWMSTLAARVPCWLRRTPLLDGTIRMGIYYPRRGRAMRLGQSLADEIVANSAAGLRAFGHARGHVIPNGVHPDVLRRAGEAGDARDGGRMRVIMAARMVADKDFDTFLDAARICAERRPSVPWEFVCLGHGDDRDRLLQRADDLIARGLVAFPEPTLDIIPALTTARCGVLLNHAGFGEGCSNSLLEYMAAGLPVVCSDTGGNREVARDGETGILVGAESPEDVASALCRLADDPELARSMGLAGRERVHSGYSYSAMVDSYIALYRSLARGGR